MTTPRGARGARRPPDRAGVLSPVLVLGVAALAAVLVSGAGAEAPAKPPSVASSDFLARLIATPTPAASTPEGDWYPVRRETIHRTLQTLGSFQAHRSTKVGSQMQGRVLSVLADVGDRVKAGEEIVRLDPVFFEIELAQREAQLATAKVSVEDTRIRLDRMTGLREGNSPSVSQQELDAARTEHDLAIARRREAEESVRYAKARLDESVIRAPFSGVVSQRFVDPGELVLAMMHSPMLEIQEMDPVELHFTLPQEKLAEVRPDMGVLFRIEGLESLRGAGRIDAIFPQVDEATRAFRVRATIPNPDHSIRPGLLAGVAVLAEEIPDALVAPRAAFGQTASGWQVVVRDGEGSARRTAKVGVSFLDKMQVLEGLAEGDLVLVPKAR